MEIDLYLDHLNDSCNFSVGVNGRAYWVTWSIRLGCSVERTHPLDWCLQYQVSSNSRSADASNSLKSGVVEILLQHIHLQTVQDSQELGILRENKVRNPKFWDEMGFCFEVRSKMADAEKKLTTQGQKVWARNIIFSLCFRCLWSDISVTVTTDWNSSNEIVVWYIWLGVCTHYTQYPTMSWV